MQLAVSHTYFNKKLEEFGHGHDDAIKQLMVLEEKQLQKAFPIPDPEIGMQELSTDDVDSSLSDASKSIFAKRLALIQDTPQSDLEIVSLFL